MKRRSLMASSLSLSLIISPFTANFAKASELPNNSYNGVHTNNQIQQLEYNGVMYTVDEGDDYRTVIAKKREGTQTFITNKSTGQISVESNFPSEEKEKRLEKQVNQMIEIEINNPITDVPTQNVRVSSVNSIDITPRAMIVSWIWSKWTSYTFIKNGKLTAQVIPQTLLSTIPYIGVYLEAFAAIMIQYKMKAGYFKKRGAIAADTDSNYLWSKIQLDLYKNNARTSLLSSKITSASKIRLY